MKGSGIKTVLLTVELMKYSNQENVFVGKIMFKLMKYVKNALQILLPQKIENNVYVKRIITGIKLKILVIF